jgi:hypothetical protein
MANKWLAHIKKTMKHMKSKGTYKTGMGLKQVIMAAKKTWHHAKKSVGLKGGADGDLVEVPLTPPATTGTEVANNNQVSEDVGGGKRRCKTRRRHTRRR